MENSDKTIKELGLTLSEDYLCVPIEDFTAIAKSFARRLKAGQMVLFFGDLGTGKTTFIRSMMATLGVNTNEVRSPTFNIVNTYETKGLTIYHIDVYRITAEELFDLGFYDYQQPNSLVLIEWAEKIIEEIEQTNYLIKLSMNSENMDTRDIKIYSGGS